MIEGENAGTVTFACSLTSRFSAFSSFIVRTITKNQDAEQLRETKQKTNGELNGVVDEDRNCCTLGLSESCFKVQLFTA